MFPLGKSKKLLLIFMRRYFNFKTKGGKSDYSKIKLLYQWMNKIFKDWDSEGFWNCLQYLITVYFRNAYCVRHCIILVIKLSSLSYTWANGQRQTVIDPSMSPSLLGSHIVPYKPTRNTELYYRPSALCTSNDMYSAAHSLDARSAMPGAE